MQNHLIFTLWDVEHELHKGVGHSPLLLATWRELA